MKHCYLIESAFGIIAAAIMLSGCMTDAPEIVPVDIAPLSAQIGNFAQANADLRAANELLTQVNKELLEEVEQLKARIRADADAGLVANEKGWLPFEGYVWRQQIARLPGIQPDEPTTSKWNEAAGLYEAGGESAMQGIINNLKIDATTQATKLGELDTQIKQLTKERDAAQESATRALEAVHDAEDALTAAVEQARQKALADVRAEQVRMANELARWCMIAAMLCAAGAVFATGVRDRLIELTILAGCSAASCFAFARWLGSEWFMPTMIAAWGLIAVAYVAWMVNKARQVKFAKNAGLVAPTVIEVLDEVYEVPENRTWMDANIFPALQDCGPAYDAAVKRIKADGLVHR
jgi:hypothetical protein